jgi:predicted porin
MRMNKTTRLLAATVAALGASSAHAVVEMYGNAFPFFESVRTSNASPTPPAANRPDMVPASAYGLNDPGRQRISVGTSAWGFRGDEDLGGGLKLVWQMESGFQIDQNTGPGISGRNSKVGLQCAMGEIFIGQWDTPYKFIGLQVNPLRGGYVFDFTGIIGNPGQGVPATTTQPGRTGAKPDAAFDKRMGNVVQYWTPKIAGFQIRAMYQANEGKTAITGGSVISPDAYGASVIWEEGAVSLRYAVEQHNDYFGMSQIGGTGPSATNRSSKDLGQKAVVMFRAGNTRLAGIYENLRYRNDDNTANAIRTYERDAWYALLEQKFGNHTAWFAYGQAYDGTCTRVGNGACSTKAIGATFWSIGWIYRFSRRTELFAAYYKLNNAMNGTYSPQPIVGPTIAAGADTTGGGVGILHFF